MNWGELKAKIRDLGFETDEIFNEYQDVIINAATRAIRIISTEVLPWDTGKLDIVQDGTETGAIKYDIEELTKNGNTLIFSSLTKAVVLNNGVYSNFNNYDMEQEKVVVMDAALPGTFSFFYTKRTTEITNKTLDTEQIQSDYRTQELIPLLAAHYVWLDDDERKATIYWNEYDDLKNRILEDIKAKSERPRGQIWGGF